MGQYLSMHTAYGILVENLFSEEEDFLKPEVCDALGIVPGSDEASLKFWIEEGYRGKDFEMAFFGDLEWEVGFECTLLVVPESVKNKYDSLNLVTDITVDRDFDRTAMDKLAESAGVKAEYYAFVSRG